MPYEWINTFKRSVIVAYSQYSNYFPIVVSFEYNFQTHAAIQPQGSNISAEVISPFKTNSAAFYWNYSVEASII